MTEKQIEPESDDARASDTEDAKQRREALEEDARKGFHKAVVDSTTRQSNETGEAGRNRGDALTLNRQEEHEYDI